MDLRLQNEIATKVQEALRTVLNEKPEGGKSYSEQMTDGTMSPIDFFFSASIIAPMSFTGATKVSSYIADLNDAYTESSIIMAMMAQADEAKSMEKSPVKKEPKMAIVGETPASERFIVSDEQEKAGEGAETVKLMPKSE
jgi:hypothetical protein